ncbi:glucosidase family protein [Kribbella endophytica]
MTIPRSADLASDVLTHTYDDMFNPPGLTNFLGTAQVDLDVFAVRSVNFPPYSHGDCITGQLYVDGRLARSYGGEVEVVWRPDHVVRTTTIDGLSLRSTTACAPGRPAVVVQLEVEGTPGREVRIGLALASTATRSPSGWLRPEPPSEPNTLAAADGRLALVGTGESASAVSLQGLDVPGEVRGQALVETTLTLDASGHARLGYVHVLAGTLEEAGEHYDACVADVPAVLVAAEQLWDKALADAFDPASDGFSGSLPVLETSNEALRKLYWWGVLGVIWFRRDNPASVLGRTYDTLMPRYWQTTTFIWDYSLSSLTHALLDPAPMRRHIEHWIDLDTHAHFGTEWLTGGPVGYWYSVNDFAMTRLVRDYVRFTGDGDFLATPVGRETARKPVGEHLHDWATAWRGLRKDHALADYGGIDNLMECVSSYIHEVASFNAANVWCLRVAAEVAERDGDVDRAELLRKEAEEQAGHVNELYIEGAGFWHARQPDGTLFPVRHCYDFNIVGTTMADDLSESQRTEMVEFFQRELQTPTWMRALSPYDADAAFSLRPDHQWNGAYPAWPADAGRALFALGRGDVALDWLPGLAKTANQGPCGQAHFVEEAVPAMAGGARKSPPQFPYLIDWSCSSSGSWVSLILEGVFGLQIGLDGTVAASPQLSTLDPDARLLGLKVGATTYDITAEGATAVS